MTDRVVVLTNRVQQNARGGKDPDRSAICWAKKGRGEMIKAPSSLQALRRQIYHKAKSEPTHRFRGLFVHVAKLATLTEAYQQAKRNGGVAGRDGRTFADIEAEGVEPFLRAIQDELRSGTYHPQPNRGVEIPKEKGKVRKLQTHCSKDHFSERFTLCL
jgi:RNA-directed DNA polymerase